MTEFSHFMSIVDMTIIFSGKIGYLHVMMFFLVGHKLKRSHERFPLGAYMLVMSIFLIGQRLK